MVNEFFKIINKKQKNIFQIIKTLYKEFPKQVLFSEDVVKNKDLKYLQEMNIIEKKENDMFTKEYKKLGEVRSFKLTSFGLKYFNEISLKKLNMRIFWLTIILVVIGVLQIIGK